ncbi:MAG: AsmA family protein [Sideroxydans sp.]|nr:AsmA family protein [Sideroxydans sp.]
MNKYLKYGLLGVGGAAVIAVGGAAYIAATFNPNDYKAQIIKAVKDSKQRELKLDGDISLTFFPSLGAKVDKLSLSEFKSTQQFAAIDNARVSLALLPLLHKQVVVNEIALSGVQVHLIKYKNGKTNIDDLLGNEPAAGDSKAPAGKQATGSAPQVKLDIASISVDHTELSYRDETSGTQYALTNLNLKTGRIANGVKSPVEFSAQVQANQPKLSLALQARTSLSIDLDKNAYQLEGLDLQAKGNAAGISNLALQATGDAGADLAQHSFNTRKLIVAVSGSKDGDNFELKLDSPRIEATGDKFSGEKLQLSARLKGANDISATLAVPAIAGTARAFGSKALSLSLDATGDALPGKHVSSEMKGSFAYDGGKQSFSASLAGGLLQSKVKAMVAVNDFADPFIRFDADVDQFDADLYFPPSGKTQGAPATGSGSSAGAPEKPFDLSALKKLNLEGKLHIGALKVSNVKSSNISINIKARNGVVNVNPLSAKLYGGGINGSVSINAAQPTPGFAVKQSLTGISVAPLLKDAASFDMLEGKGNVAVNVTTQGNTVSALKKALNGSMSLDLADGAIKGINIAKKLRDAQAMLGKGGGSAQTQAVNKDEKTDFSELKASFRINNGVAHNDDLSLKSPLLRVTGNGDIDLGHDSLNYVTKATLVGSLQGQGGQSNLSGLTVPVRLSGPFNSLKYTLDFGAMVGEAAKQKVKSKLEEQLKGGLKGLFR